MSEQFSFDDEWVAAARHREPSVAELEALRRAERRAHRRVRRHALFRSTLGTVVVLGFLVGFVWFVVTANSQSTPALRLADHVGNVQLGTVSGDDRPTPDAGSAERLRPEVIAVNPNAAHAFVATRDDGTPVRYDPCRPVRFVVNPDQAPPEYLRIIGEVLATGSAATGIQLELVEATTETPTMDRKMFQPDRYGDQWAPVLIAWTDESVITDLVGDVAGVGGSAWLSGSSNPGWLVSGTLFLDTDLGSDAKPNETVMLHELGHVLGLDHVDDPEQIMYPRAGTTHLGEGDLAGLAAVGAGACAGAL